MNRLLKAALTVVVCAVLAALFFIQNDQASRDETGLPGSKAAGKSTANVDSGKAVIPAAAGGNLAITLSLAGDCRIGNALVAGKEDFTFDTLYRDKGSGYFYEKVRDIFKADDLTVVNLETTLTDAQQRADKRVNFRGKPAQVHILRDSDIEAVNIANNHMYDYLEEGYLDTVETLKKAKIGYFGFGHRYIASVKGKKIGFAGYEVWRHAGNLEARIKEDIAYLRKNADLVLVSFHWGEERVYIPNKQQKFFGHFALDQGADLVFGGHPHVVQGIEKYRGKYIVYSLGNFSFGGSIHLFDLDSFIFQPTFVFNRDGKLTGVKTKIIPVSISSVKGFNNFQPMPLEGKEKERVLKKIKDLSERI